MIADLQSAGLDPRQILPEEDLAAASLRATPAVARLAARGSQSLGMVAGVIAALGLGGATFAAMSGRRATPPRAVVAAPEPPAAPFTAPPARLDFPPARISSAQGSIIPVANSPSMNAIDPAQSRANPLIVDNTGGGETVVAVHASEIPSAAPAAPPGQAAGLTQDEVFSERVGADSPPIAHAVSLGDPKTVVVQGSIIPAVLETALNSDLPGYARAIVSRDVGSFDGSRVLIPRGSRLIGQYKSGLAVGQSRAFIVWTRLIRPDGVSVQLASPVVDETGQTGVGGKVNRHFVQRFGSAVLLSVVSGLAGSLSDSSSSTVVIGSSSDATSAAGQALQSDSKISPTIHVPQGTPIQVFTARDLDFSGL